MKFLYHDSLGAKIRVKIANDLQSSERRSISYSFRRFISGLSAWNLAVINNWGRQTFQRAYPLQAVLVKIDSKQLVRGTIATYYASLTNRRPSPARDESPPHIPALFTIHLDSRPAKPGFTLLFLCIANSYEFV